MIRYKPLVTKNLALLLFSVVVSFILTIAVDRCVALLVGAPQNLVFERYSIANYSTPEFHIRARVNNLGFRGDDVEVRKSRTYRVIALGDSFTFGWGVDFRDTWPQVLEDQLRSKGIDAQVLNLGQPGTYTAQYSAIAQRAIPVLKPDLILVAVTQGDDLAQTMRALETAPDRGPEHPVLGAVKRAIKSLYPNLVALRVSASPTSPLEIEANRTWKDQAASLIQQLKPDEKARFDRMDDEIRDLFVNGALNPGLLAIGMQHPDELRRTLDLNSLTVREGIQEITKDLLGIKGALGSNERIAVVSLPNGFFISPLMHENYGRMGFTVDDSDLTTTAMDEAARMSAEKAGLDFYEVTEEFRKESSKRELFYRFDGHYNAEGQRLFAQSIEPAVRKELIGIRH